MLDVQIQALSTDTGNFYSNREAYLHWLNHKLRAERNQLINGVNGSENKKKRSITGLKDVVSELSKFGIEKAELELINKQEYDYSQWGEDAEVVAALGRQYCYLRELIDSKNQRIKDTKNALLKLLSQKVEENIRTNGKHHIRTLRENQVSSKNTISVFDSSFTRMIGAKQDELCEDFLVVQVYYFDVIKDLIYHGFMYKGEKYIYFTSSAGQIRTKKTVFIRESVWNKYEKTIMCGLTIDAINEKGGNNPNKHLAYMALANSATDVWEEFDIDKAIVIDDFETDVFGTYDLVDDTDYTIKRMSGNVPIPHTDGAGMMLPTLGKNRMVRLPWVKGLLGAFDFAKFVKVNGCSPIIKDIYGKEHDILAEDIQVIFTKSQFKMWKYYDSWEQYKTFYKMYGCTAGYTNIEEDRIKDATINYQMLQSLTDITDDEILTIASPSIQRLENLTSSVDNIKAAFGITPYNTHMNAFQKCIQLYPNLLNDEYVKAQLREIKDSYVKRYKAGKLQVHGKYTFLLPDFYAACEYWFMGEKSPKGLLEDGEVFCWLFRKNQKLDCLRSPHLYREHAIRNNVAWYGAGERQQQLREWFTTDAIYTSCHDLISKILQFDVDGDKALVVADPTIIQVAERNMKDIVPLYYNMKKAQPVQLSNDTIYKGLNAAFTGSNIGQYSNNISKIWNSEVFVSGSEEEQQQAIDVIKLLCMENNMCIDSAKTLYMPERPHHIKKLVTQFTKANVPHFFKYAKDKEDWQVAEYNSTFVNKLSNVIPNPRINCRSLGLGTIDYKMLMDNPGIECKVSFDSKGKLDKANTDPLIIKYIEFNQKYGYTLSNAARTNTNISPDMLVNTQAKQDVVYKQISDEIRAEFAEFGYSESEITDILVKYLYGIKESKHKVVLWLCYGEYILANLERQLRLQTKTTQCIDCGEWIEVSTKDNKTCRCKECTLERKRELTQLRVQKHRKNSVTLTN